MVKLGPIIISIIVTVGFITAVVLLMTAHVNTSSTAGQAFLILMGSLAQGFAQVTGYWIGSSAGSAAKTDAMAALANKVGP